MENVETTEQEQDLTLDDIMAASDRNPLPIRVKAWQKNGKPGRIWLKPMSAFGAISHRRRMALEPDRNGTIVSMFVEMCCDASGRQLFTTPEQVEALKEKSWAVFLELQDRLLQMNGMMQPTKTWATVAGILAASGVPDDVVARVRKAWADDDEAEVKNS